MVQKWKIERIFCVLFCFYFLLKLLTVEEKLFSKREVKKAEVGAKVASELEVGGGEEGRRHRGEMVAGGEKAEEDCTKKKKKIIKN